MSGSFAEIWGDHDSSQNVSSPGMSDGSFSSIWNEDDTEPQAQQTNESEPQVRAFDDLSVPDEFDPQSAQAKLDYPVQDRPRYSLPKSNKIPTEQRSGKGMKGLWLDVASGAASGVLQGTGMVYKAMEWFAPEGTDLEATSKYMADLIQQVKEDDPASFGESKESQKANEKGAFNWRGWIHPGFKSIGEVAVGSLAGGSVGPVLQFWGSTAQDAYDEAVDNEKMGIGRKLTENEKLAYANLRGFWEGGLELLELELPFKITKWLPGSVQGKIIRSAMKEPGSVLFNIAKKFLATGVAEAGMETLQEYLGDKTAYLAGQSTVDPGWDEVKGVIGPTIIMTAVLGTMAMHGESKRRVNIHEALTSEDVPAEYRTAAVGAVYDYVHEKDPELAKMWKDYAGPLAKEGKPVAIPLDQDMRDIAAGKTEALTGEPSGETAPITLGKNNTKLKEALDIEQQIENEQIKNAELKGQIDSRLEYEQDKAEREQKKAPKNKEKGIPNEKGVIEPELKEAKVDRRVLEKRIYNLETTIKDNPDHPKIEQFKEALLKNKAELKKLDKGESKKSTADLSGQEEESSIVEMPQRPEILTQDYVDEKYKKILNIPEGSVEDNLSPEFDPQKMTVDSVTKELENTDNVDMAKKSLLAHIADKVGDLIATSRYESSPEGVVYEKHLDELIKTVDNFHKEITPKELRKKYTKSWDASGTKLVYINKETHEKFTLDYLDKGKKGWYQIQEGKENLFLGETQKEALFQLDKNSQKQTGKNSSVKFSTHNPGELLIDKEEVPIDMKVETVFTSSETGQQTKIELNAKKALESSDSILDKLSSILDCVKS